ncbi:MAG: hypothetical protein E7017_07495 [Alphaproteobacteria bacterium]|nr:hypothetical protein [Alphaproteobacteria bacterium]
MNKTTLIKQKSIIEKWFQKINRAENIYSEYHKLIKDIRKYYRGEIHKDKQNIFWSSIETLKPFLYFKMPKPYIERKEKSNNKSHNLACRIIEKALIWNLEQFDFDSTIKYARNDFLLGGIGLLIERYKPTFTTIEEEDGKKFDIKIDEQVNSEYIDPVNFIADTEKVGIWEDCTWFAIKHYMSPNEAILSFGEEFAPIFDEASFDGNKSIEIYEIWDKENCQVIYLSKSSPEHILKTIKKSCSQKDFFPLPKPLFASCTNDSIIPVPDYVQIKPLLDELDGVTYRMEKTMKAIKISGCYDNAFPELANILNKDISLVSISDFDRLKTAGGLKNIVDFMPIDQYITALQTLAQRRQDIINSIYEITGVSDIMRGTSTIGDTATAINKKTCFGTLRNQDRQNDMHRFIAELFKIKADIICEQFDTEKLISFLPISEQNTPEAVLAVNILKTDKLRDMILGIETDTTFSEADIVHQNIEAVTAIHTIIEQAFDVVSKQPALLDLYRQMINSIANSMSNARQYENILSNCFEKIAQEFATPDVVTDEPDMQLLALQLQNRHNDQDYEIKKEQNEIKKAEILLKHQQEHSKNLLTEKEMNIQAVLKSDGKDAAINTGLVKNL